MVNLVIYFNSLVPKPNYSDRNACANKIVLDQIAPRSSLIWGYLFTFFSNTCITLNDNYRMNYSVLSYGRFHFRNSALNELRVGKNGWETYIILFP